MRKKRNSLPIKICIKINIENKIPKVEYFLGKYKKDLEEIRNFLFEAKNDYLVDSFLRYILNHIDNNNKINEGEKARIRNVTDYFNNKK